MSDDLDLMDGMNGEENMIITLTDESGEEMNFEVLDALELDEYGQYVMVTPVEEGKVIDENEEQEVIVLKVIQGENGDENVFATIEDEEEMNAVFAEFESRWAELDEEE